jgi:hypothetical protein
MVVQSVRMPGPHAFAMRWTMGAYAGHSVTQSIDEGSSGYQAGFDLEDVILSPISSS